MTVARRCRPSALQIGPLITFVIGRLSSTPVYLVTLRGIYQGSATDQLCDLELILNLTEFFSTERSIYFLFFLGLNRDAWEQTAQLMGSYFKLLRRRTHPIMKIIAIIKACDYYQPCFEMKIASKGLNNLSKNQQRIWLKC